MNWPVERVIRIGFVSALLVLLGLGCLSYRAASQLVESDKWVSHTHEVLTDLASIEASITRAESSQRGYILTQDDALLLSYRSAILATHKLLDEIAFQTSDNPVQRANIALLRPMVKARLDLLEEHLGIETRAGLSAAEAAIRGSNGAAQATAIRNQVQRMEDEENRLMTLRYAWFSRSARATFVLFALAAGLQLALLILVYTLMARDLERRRQSESQLRAAADELRSTGAALERSNRELQDFASVASHDLQEPLRKIQAFGDRLKARFADALTADGIDYLQRMQAAANRMQTLINDLLSFSRVTSRAQPYIRVDLNQVVREVLVDLEIRLEQMGGRVEIVGQLPTLDADPVQMRQLVQNLIGNALKFHKPDEKPLVIITAQWPGHPLADRSVLDRLATGNGEMDELSAGPPPQHCQLIVADNGIGFDLKYLDRIFTVFQRLHGRSEFEGTGVGLAVCRKIAHRHGGSITAHSAPGQGATFIVTLPLQQQTPPPPPPREPAARPLQALTQGAPA
jgi:signal transduction histidine kinase